MAAAPKSSAESKPPRKSRQHSSFGASDIIAPFLAANLVSQGNSFAAAGIRNGLKSQYNTNMLFSPFSLSVLGAIIYLGAKNKTREEIGKAFSFPSNDDVIKMGFLKILSTLQDHHEGFSFNAAQRIYAHTKATPIFPEFIKMVESNFSPSPSRTDESSSGSGTSTSFREVDFTKHKDVANEINEWIEEETSGRIQYLVNAGDVDSRISMLLVSGVHFEGDWAIAFDPADTIKEPFYVHKNLTVHVDMMKKVSSFPYGFLKQVKAHVCCLPFGSVRSQVNFILFVPDSLTGLLEIEKNLAKLSPSAIVKDIKVDKVVHLSLPRFKMKFQINLGDAFKEMGMKTMFKESGKDGEQIADFTSLSKSNLCVSQVIQKIRMGCCEKGCFEGPDCLKATRRSKSSFVLQEKQTPHVEIKADHPFLFQVVDLLSNVVLISGTCRDPTKVTAPD